MPGAAICVNVTDAGEWSPVPSSGAGLAGGGGLPPPVLPPELPPPDPPQAVRAKASREDAKTNEYLDIGFLHTSQCTRVTAPELIRTAQSFAQRSLTTARVANGSTGCSKSGHGIGRVAALFDLHAVTDRERRPLDGSKTARFEEGRRLLLVHVRTAADCAPRTPAAQQPG